MPPTKTPLPFPTRTGLLIETRLDSPARRREGKRNLRRNQLLGAYRLQGAMSRVEAARYLGFNLRTVSLLVDDLVRQNLLVEHESRITASGRRPVPLSLNQEACSLLGIYAGISTTRMVLMDLAGEELAQTAFKSEFPKDPAVIGDWLFEKITAWLKDKSGDMPPLGGVGLSMEGMAQGEEKLLDYIAGAAPIRMRLEELLNIPVVVEHDSYLTALGERWFGAGQGKSSMAVFNLAEGLGFAVIQNGHFFRGARNWSGEMGHLPFGEPEVPCYCGSKGCIENIVSTHGLLRLAKLRGLKAESAEEVADLASNGNQIAASCFEQFGKTLALAVAISTTLYNPEIVVLSGRLARFNSLFKASFDEALPKAAVPFIISETEIVVSTLGGNAVTQGTCAVLLQKIFGTDNARVEELL